MALIKILPRHTLSFKNLYTYIVKEGKNEKPHIFLHNVHKDTVIQDYLQNESFRVKNRPGQIYFYHEILSLNPKDSVVLNEEVIEDLGRKYIELRGNKGLFFGAVHNDVSHTHIHYMVSGIQLYTSKSMRLSRKELNELQVEFQKYHELKYPQIAHSSCEFGNQKTYIKDKKWYKDKRENMNITIKETVKNALNKANTKKEFIEILRKENLPHYERGKDGDPKGIVIEKNHFRFSTLGIDMEKLNNLPDDLTEEQQAFDEIQNIRNKREEPTRNRMLRFEENGLIKSMTFSDETKEVSWQEPDGTQQIIEEELSENESQELERMADIVEDYEAGLYDDLENEQSEDYDISDDFEL